MDDKKNGAGRFFYLDTGQVLEGVWVNDGPKCGEMTDYGREAAGEGRTQYPIPANELADPSHVLQTATEMFTQEIEQRKDGEDEMGPKNYITCTTLYRRNVDIGE